MTRAPGDLLWPAREGPEEMAQRTVELGAYGFAGQYQQSPSPRTGGLFERRWWAFYDDLPTGVDAGIQSWDLSVKGGPGHDFVVGLVAARRGADIYLVDRVKAQLSFPDTLAAIRQTCRQYPSARTILVEDTANGPAVIDTLRHEIPGIIAVQPQGDKVQRATACARASKPGTSTCPGRPARPGAASRRGRGSTIHRAAGGVSHGGARRRRGCVHPAAPALATAADVARDDEAHPAGGEWVPAATALFLAGRPHPRGEG